MQLQNKTLTKAGDLRQWRDPNAQTFHLHFIRTPSISPSRQGCAGAGRPPSLLAVAKMWGASELIVVPETPFLPI